MNASRFLSLLLCLSLLLGLLCGCTTTEDPRPSQPPTETGAPDDGIIDIGTDPLPCSEEELYRQLFDPENRIDVSIDMPQEELAKLQHDFETIEKSPIYRIADLTITITTPDASTTYRIPEVGVRMKGNTSRTDFYSPEEGIYNAIHLKLDFQETFDDEELYGDGIRIWDSEEQRDARKDRTFAAMEKLEMRWNKCYDSTYLREGYAYQLYRAYGVLAPLTNLCSFDFSGVHMGVYTINEPVDKRFLEKRLDEADLGGDLYKLGWTYTGATFTKPESIGIEDELKGEFYAYDLKTNKKTSDHQSLTSLILALNSGSVTKESFAALVDVEYFLNYAAVSYFLGNPDDLRNNYNNCYLYFLQSSGKAIIIPYDYDRCLGVTYEWDPTGDGMTTDNPFADCSYGINNQPTQQRNPLFLYSVDMGGYYVAEFADVLQIVAEDELLKPETFRARFRQAEEMYGDDAQPSRELRNGYGRDWGFSLESPGSGNLSFERYIRAKLRTFAGYMESLDEYLHYVRPIPQTHVIRGDFSNWEIQEPWQMDWIDGSFTATLSFGHSFSFKVYDSSLDRWYGIECLPEDTDLVFTSDHYGNLNLTPGTYYVTFDPVTDTLTVTKQ